MEVPRVNVASLEGLTAGIAWPVSEWLAVSWEPNESDSGQRLWGLRPDGGGLQELGLRRHGRRCLKWWHLYPTSLADSRVAFVEECSSPDEAEPPLFTMHAYDLRTGEQEQFVDGRLRYFGQGQFSWDPSLERGVFANVNAPCVRMGWLTREGEEIPDFVITDGATGWNLKQNFEGDRDFLCEDVGGATWPDWSPDGRAIAFFASLGGLGSAGLERLDRQWTLYLMDPQDEKPRPVLKEVTHPQSPRWSPNSRWFAFSASIDGRTGTFLLEPSRQRLIQISGDEMKSIAWNPDGSQLAAVLPTDEDEEQIVLLDVASVIEQ